MTDYANQALHLLDGGAIDRVKGYFRGNYSGAEWDRWPTDDEAHITRLDIASLSLLSIPVGHKLMTGKLSGMEVPDVGFTDIRSAPFPDPDGDWAPLYQLWSRLPQEPGVGRVVASKLLARKLPHLIPIWDKEVMTHLWGFSSTNAARRFNDWPAAHSLMDDDRVVERLTEIRTQADLDENVSLLRVLDVAVWMRGQAN